MIRKELAKDPRLANESWDRFLPLFRKRHLKTSEKTAKKNEKLQVKAEARTAGLVANADGAKKETRKEKDKKKVYTPFPPAQQPRKVCNISNDLIVLGPLSPNEGDSVASVGLAPQGQVVKQYSISSKPLLSVLGWIFTFFSDRPSIRNWRVFPESTRERSTRNTATEATGQIISTLLAPYKSHMLCPQATGNYSKTKGEKGGGLCCPYRESRNYRRRTAQKKTFCSRRPQ